MNFVSTKNSKNQVSFKESVLNCIPADGGLYVPDECEDLRRWILYSDEKTSFSSLAGSLTSAMINKEFSPIICETIASRAFSKDPVFRQLDKNLFILELYHGSSGIFKDYGVSYLTATLETILQYDGKKSIILEATSGDLGACIAPTMRGKKLLKSVLLCPKGKLRGLKESDFVWNGGNIYPVEIDGTEEDCLNLIRQIYSNEEYVEKYHLTLANTANIGRLLPQSFFYTYAFSRIKKLVSGDIYYALPIENYGNLVAGLYSWKLSLPVNGFIVPSSNTLRCDEFGKCIIFDDAKSIKNRQYADVADPSNLERFEQVFKANSLMMKSFVFPADVSQEETKQACKELYKKYGVIADSQTAKSYAASLKRSDVINEDEGAVVLIAENAPCREKDFIKDCLNIDLEMSSNVQEAFTPVITGKDVIASTDIESLISILNSLNLLHLF